MRAGTPDTMEAWMRDIQRRLTRLEQEPRITTPPVLLGAVVPEDGSDQDHDEVDDQ